MVMRFAATSFRPGFGRGLSVVITAIAAAGLAGFIATGDWIGLARYGWGFALLATTGITLFWLPRLDFDEREVTVRNVFSTVHIPWSAIERIDTKWALTIYTHGPTIAVWASPAPSRYATGAAGPGDAKLAAGVSGTNPRPGDLLGTPSGAAAFIIRRHLEDLREDGLLDDSESAAVSRDIHWVTISALCALTVATLLGATL